MGTTAPDSSTGWGQNRIYVGTRCDANIISMAWNDRVSGPCSGADLFAPVLFPFALIDLPLSLVIDTALLFYTVPKYLLSP